MPLLPPEATARAREVPGEADHKAYSGEPTVGEREQGEREPPAADWARDREEEAAATRVGPAPSESARKKEENKKTTEIPSELECAGEPFPCMRMQCPTPSFVRPAPPAVPAITVPK